MDEMAECARHCTTTSLPMNPVTPVTMTFIAASQTIVVEWMMTLSSSLKKEVEDEREPR